MLVVSFLLSGPRFAFAKAALQGDRLHGKEE